MWNCTWANNTTYRCLQPSTRTDTVSTHWTLSSDRQRDLNGAQSVVGHRKRNTMEGIKLCKHLFI